MTVAGYKSIEIAKQNGSWTILDEVEALIIPDDQQHHFILNNPFPEKLKIMLSAGNIGF